MRETINYVRNMIYGLDTLVQLNDKRRIPAVNLDNAATTPPLKQVMDEISEQMLFYGSVGRGKGQKSERTTAVYNNGRSIIKNFLGANSDDYEVFYCQSTTDGINKLASALLQDNSEDMVLTTRMEHHANDLPWRERAKTVYADVDEKGRLLISDMEKLLEEHEGKIKYVSVTAASNVTGYVNNIHKIARLAHKHGAKIIVDGAQIVAHRGINMRGIHPDERIDFFVFSAHKMYSPFGGGAVVGLKEVLDKHVPQFYGGGMVAAVCDDKVSFLPAPDSYEAGSPNFPGIAGMIKAIDVLQAIGFGYIKRYEQFLMRYAISKLKKIPGIILYGDNRKIADRVGVIPFNLQGICPKATAEYLAGSHGIAVRHAAFCAHPYVSRLLQEHNQDTCAPPEGMVRASFGIYTNKEDVDKLLQAVALLAESINAPINAKTVFLQPVALS